MPSRPVHWYEGMFLRPHHLQAADRHARAALRESEDWFHPFGWGLRSVDLDRDAINNYTAAVRSCAARFKDGTRVSIPADCALDPLELKDALAGPGPVTIYLAVPAIQSGRANVEDRPTPDGPRFWVETLELDDENTGAEDQPIQVRRTRARLLLSGQDHAGYEVLPLARVERSAQVEAPPQVDPAYVPPLLAIDAWPPLWRAVQSLHHQIGARVEQLSAQLVDRGISFESQVPGDAERLLKLMALNAAVAGLGAFAPVRGLTPLVVYQELCRLVGQLAIFGPTRRPPALPPYDHEDLGGCFTAVIKYVQLGLDLVPAAAFEKRYFERMGERLQVSLEPGWLTNLKSLYLGVETELSDRECQALLDAMDMKVGSGAQVEHYYRQRVQGLKLTPVARPPRALPAGTGVVYYQVERDPVFWRDVADSHTMGIRLNLNRAAFQSDRILAVRSPQGTKTANLQFALFVT